MMKRGSGTDVALLLLRLVFGLQMALLHGQGKLQRLLDGAHDFSDPLGIGGHNSLIGAVAGEFLCGILLALGLGTRAAAAGMAFTMMIAAFVVHGGDPWKRKELALVYLAVAVTLIITGAGRLSLDRWLVPKLRGLFGKRVTATRVSA